MGLFEPLAQRDQPCIVYQPMHAGATWSDSGALPSDCPTCAGQRDFDGRGGAVCLFCGTPDPSPSLVTARRTTVSALTKQEYAVLCRQGRITIL